jgi:RimJ/RimL family protein N-acetyltransferase
MTDRQGPRLPTYTTPRLIVRPRAPEDIPALLDLDRDPEVMRFLGGPATDLAAHRDLLHGRITRDWGKGLGFWSVVPADDPSRYLGWVLLVPIEGEGPQIEIGWRFARAAWGHGFAAEAARVILQHGFEVVRLDEIVAVIDPDNHRSHAVARRIGLAPSGEHFAYRKMLSIYRLRRDQLMFR